MKVSNYSTSLARERGESHSFDSSEKAFERKRKRNGEIGVRKGVERCCKIGEGAGNEAEGERGS